jgi:hypothetical protein
MSKNLNKNYFFRVIFYSWCFFLYRSSSYLRKRDIWREPAIVCIPMNRTLEHNDRASFAERNTMDTFSVKVTSYWNTIIEEISENKKYEVTIMAFIRAEQRFISIIKKYYVKTRNPYFTTSVDHRVKKTKCSTIILSPKDSV